MGKKHDTCSILKVHTVMEDISYDTYLWDIIRSDDKNKMNVKKIIFKGPGIISQIMILLSYENLVKFYMEIIILLM